MTTVNSALLSDLAVVSPGNRQADAQNQKDAWLRQMELSQMSLLQELAQQNTGSSEKGNGDAMPKDASDEQNETDASSQNSTYNSATDSASTMLLPVHPIMQQGSTEHDSVPSTPALESTSASTANAVMTDAASTPSSGIDAANTTTINRGMSTPGLSHVNALKISPDTLNPASVAQDASIQKTQTLSNDLDQSSSSSIVASALADQLGSAPAQQISMMTPTNVGSIASIALRTTLDSVPQSKDESSESSDVQKSDPSEKYDTASNDAWQKRLMHVAQEGKNISVSIRDNTLDAHQSSQIVSRLASDAVQSGLRLRSATVNGKTLIKPRTGAQQSNTILLNTEAAINPTTSTLEHQE